MGINILLRQIRNSGFLSLVKLLSLFLGLTISIVIVSWVRKELSYDDFWENSRRIYRVSMEQYQNGELQFRMAPVYRGITDVMLEELPEVEGRLRLHRDKITIFTPEAQVQDVTMFYADTCVFDILKRNIVARESGSLFPDLRSVVISESLSRKIFGNVDPIGRSLKLNEGWQFYVSAVFEDIPEESHLHFDLLMTIPSLNYYMSNFNNFTGELDESKAFEYKDPGPYDRGSWGRFYGYSYILVKEGTDIREVEAKAESLIRPEKLPSSFSETRINLIFDRIDQIHLHSNLAEEIKVNGSILKVYALLLVALIVLIISMVNFINLSLIGFYEQSVNSALRRIHGAQTRDLLKQVFLKELFIGIASGIMAFAVSYFALRAIVPGAEPGPESLLLVASVILVGALLTLILPFYHFQSHSLHDLLKKKILVGTGGNFSRKLLVSLQFGISLFLIAGTIVIFFQLRFIRTTDPGFVPDAIIYSYSPMTMNQRPDIPEKLSAFRSRIAEIPGVKSFCTSSSVPGVDFLMHSENVSKAGNEPDRQTYYQILNTDYSYIPTYQLELLAGRNFLLTDQFPDKEVILNEMAARKLGFENHSEAIGSSIRVDGAYYSVCGVVKNFHHLSLKQELTPVIIFKSLQWRYAVGYYSFKVVTADLKPVLPLIEKAWTETYPGERFLFRFLDVKYREQYHSEENFGKSLSLGSFLAILISCLGLLGYARYSAVKRIREIGIRKTFGATNLDILMLFNKETAKMVIYAAMISLPLAWLIVNKWLQNFVYRIEISLWMFLSALLITAIITLGSTFWVSWKASLRNPVDSLKSE